tara:strand:+ start:3949 stop:4719 length:771 start_codon:yes stop_codon:yes gene_type:complete
MTYCFSIFEIIAVVSYVLIFVIAGLVKGVVGFGTPLITVPFIGMIHDIPTAVGWSLLPIIFSNLLQAYECRGSSVVFKRVWPLLACLSVSLILSVQLLKSFHSSVITMLVGFLILFFVSSQFFPRPPKIAERWQSPVLVVAGITSGFIGGLTSFYGFPALQALISIDLNRREFILSTSALFLLGTGVLGTGMLVLGLVSVADLLISLLFVFPTILGTELGGRMSERLSIRTFRIILLLVLSVAGSVMILRSIYSIL